MIADAGDVAAAQYGFMNLSCHVPASAHRFLDKKWNAFFARNQLLFPVREGGSTDIYGVQLLFVVHFLVVGVGSAAIILRGFVRSLLRDVAHCGKFDIVESRQIPQMTACHSADADRTNFYFIHNMFSSLNSTSRASRTK